MSELPPILKLMQAQPERIWFTADFPALAPVKNPGRDLAAYALRGNIERVAAPTAKHPRRVGWRWLRKPLAHREFRTLNPALPGTQQGKLMRVFEANPDAWISNRDLSGVYPGRSQFDFMELLRKGYLERRKNADGNWEYHLLRLPTTGGRQGYSRRPARPDEVKRTPCPAARSKPKQQTVKRPPVVADEVQEAQQQAARQAHWDKTHAMRTEAQQRVMAFLHDQPEPVSATQIKDALGLTLGVMKTALVALAHNGLIIEIAGIPTTYRLLSPEFPEVPAAMNRAAERVYGLLFGRADTELGLMQLTGWRRPEVRAALARLYACGRLEWSGVGHLLIYRVREVAQERAA